MISKNKEIKNLNSAFITSVANMLDDASMGISELYARRKMNVSAPAIPNSPAPAPPMPQDIPMEEPLVGAESLGNNQPTNNPSLAGQAVNAFLNSANSQGSQTGMPTQGMQAGNPSMAQGGQSPSTDQEKMEAVQQFAQQTGQDPISIVEGVMSGNLRFIPGKGIIGQNQTPPPPMGNMPQMM